MVATKLGIDNTDALCQHYLNIIYSSTNRHHAIGNPIHETQGEILYSGVDKLLSVMQLTSEDVFVDLGSGAGKIVTQVFLKSIVKQACGIEIVPALHQQALAVAQRIQEDFPASHVAGRRLTFLSNNFLEEPLTMATVVLVNAVCFDQTVLHALGEIIEVTPNIRLVLSMRPIATLHRLRFKKTVRVECSWDAGLCYVYK